MLSVCIILTFQGGFMFEILGGDGKRIRFERLAGSANCAVFNQLVGAHILLYGLLSFESVDSP